MAKVPTNNGGTATLAFAKGKLAKPQGSRGFNLGKPAAEAAPQASGAEQAGGPFLPWLNFVHSPEGESAEKLRKLNGDRAAEKGQCYLMAGENSRRILDGTFAIMLDGRSYHAAVDGENDYVVQSASLTAYKSRKGEKKVGRHGRAVLLIVFPGAKKTDAPFVTLATARMSPGRFDAFGSFLRAQRYCVDKAWLKENEGQAGIADDFAMIRCGGKVSFPVSQKKGTNTTWTGFKAEPEPFPLDARIAEAVAEYLTTTGDLQAAAVEWLDRECADFEHKRVDLDQDGNLIDPNSAATGNGGESGDDGESDPQD